MSISNKRIPFRKLPQFLRSVSLLYLRRSLCYPSGPSAPGFSTPFSCPMCITWKDKHLLVRPCRQRINSWHIYSSISFLHVSALFRPSTVSWTPKFKIYYDIIDYECNPKYITAFVLLMSKYTRWTKSRYAVYSIVTVYLHLAHTVCILIFDEDVIAIIK
jgi:hypothetical protein